MVYEALCPTPGGEMVTLVNPMVLMLLMGLGLIAVLWCLYKAIR